MRVEVVLLIVVVRVVIQLLILVIAVVLLLMVVVMVVALLLIAVVVVVVGTTSLPCLTSLYHPLLKSYTHTRQTKLYKHKNTILSHPILYTLLVSAQGREREERAGRKTAGGREDNGWEEGKRKTARGGE